MKNDKRELEKNLVILAKEVKSLQAQNEEMKQYQELNDENKNLILNCINELDLEY